MKHKDLSNNYPINRKLKPLQLCNGNLNTNNLLNDKISLKIKINNILKLMREDRKQEMFKKFMSAMDNNLVVNKKIESVEKEMKKLTLDEKAPVLLKKEISNVFDVYGIDYQTFYNPLFENKLDFPAITFKPKTINKKKVTIEKYVETLDDLLELIKEHPLDEELEYNINMKGLHNIKKPLKDLNNMVGMKALKNSVVDQILYFIQELHKNNKNESNDFMHTVIYGPPGTGKTEIAKLMGSIFSKLGILKKNVFKKVTRSDLVAGYLGQTAIKTRQCVEDCLGGVLFIDEAYALGNPEKRDSFAKECIDTLCELLSDNKENLMVIIAGYQEELKNCFFAYNQGLDSRFTWRFKTDDYNAEELKKIFMKKVKDASWDFETPPKTSWFEKNKAYFKFYGRDMENLFAKTKIAHSRRIFGKSSDLKRKLNDKDLQKGLEIYLNNDEVKDRKQESNDHLFTMYN